MPSAYMPHSIRGKKGMDATLEDMERNNQIAIAAGKKIREAYPTLELYVPGDHDEFVTDAYVDRMITEEQILAIDCKILARRDFLIVFSPDAYISNGMRVEINKAQELGMPIVYIWDINDLRSIKLHLQRLMR